MLRDLLYEPNKMVGFDCLVSVIMKHIIFIFNLLLFTGGMLWTSSFCLVLLLCPRLFFMMKNLQVNAVTMCWQFIC